MGLEPAARRLLERDSRARPLRRRRRAGVHPVGLAGRLQEPGAAGGRRARREGKDVAGIIGAWGHKYPFNGYPGPRVDWLRLHRHALVGPLAEGQDPSPRRRLAAIAGVARRIEGAEQIGLRRRHRQMGGRGRRLALARQAEDPLSAERTIASATRPSARPTRAPASRCSIPRCWRRAPGANAAMTIFPAIRRAFDKESLYFDSDPLRRGFRQLRLSRGRAHPQRRPADRLARDQAQRGEPQHRRLPPRHLSLLQSRLSRRRHGRAANRRAGRAFQHPRAAQPHGSHLQAGLAHQARASRRRSIRRCGNRRKP